MISNVRTYIKKDAFNHAAGDGISSPWGKSLGIFISHVKKYDERI